MGNLTLMVTLVDSNMYRTIDKKIRPHKKNQLLEDMLKTNIMTRK